MIKKCITLNGEIINIGDWEYLIETIYKKDEKGNVLYDENNNPIIDKIVNTNPLPEGAIEEELDVELVNGKFIRVDSPTAYQSYRKQEYPPLAEQLDAIWKGGSSMDDMRNKIMAIKSKYPKSK